METVRVVPNNRPLFGEDWPNPPDPEPSNVKRVPSQTAAAVSKQRGYENVLRCAVEAYDSITDLGEWLDERGDHSYDADIRIVEKWLDRLIEHYQTALEGRLG
jgi:hypothetical protein